MTGYTAQQPVISSQPREQPRSLVRKRRDDTIDSHHSIVKPETACAAFLRWENLVRGHLEQSTTLSDRRCFGVCFCRALSDSVGSGSPSTWVTIHLGWILAWSAWESCSYFGVLPDSLIEGVWGLGQNVPNLPSVHSCGAGLQAASRATSWNPPTPTVAGLTDH